MFSQAREQLHEFLTNPIFLAGIFSWFAAQFIKALIKLLSGKVRSFAELFALMFWRTGGMPSSHSALVCSLITSIGFKDGFGSDIFCLAFAFAAVTVRDALGVRRSSGLNAKTINRMGEQLSDKKLIHFNPVKEINGHEPLEVVMGCFLGIFIGTAFSIL